MKQAVPCPAIYNDMKLEKDMIVINIYPGMAMDLPHVGQPCMWRNEYTREGGTGKVSSINRKMHTYEMKVLCVFTDV